MTEIKFNQKQYEAGKLMMDALTGDRIAKNKFFEALTTSDLPTLLEPSLNKQVKNSYESIPVQWELFAAREIVDDFRLQEIVKYTHNTEGIPDVNSGEPYVEGSLPRIPELGEYPTIGVSATGVQFRLAKSGVQFELSWERLINDRNLNELERAWTRFAKMARNTEEIQATKQFVTSSGLNTDNLSSDNLLSGNPVLDASSLETAWLQAAQHKVDGHRIVMPGKFNLLVPSTLEFQARKILADYEVRNGTDPVYLGPNHLAGKFDIVVNDWISTLDETNGDTTWGIMPKPNVIEDGGAAVAFLRGHENPRFFVRNTTLQNPEDGDYDHDAYSTKVRHTATGVWRGEGAGIVFSDGSKS